MQESSPPPNPLLSQNLHKTQTANKPPTRRLIGGLCASRRVVGREVVDIYNTYSQILVLLLSNLVGDDVLDVPKKIKHFAM